MLWSNSGHTVLQAAHLGPALVSGVAGQLPLALGHMGRLRSGEPLEHMLPTAAPAACAAAGTAGRHTLRMQLCGTG
jgi:hypothetical protein